MDKWLEKVTMVDYHIEKALRYARLEDDSEENRKKFARICEIVKEEKDPFTACCFASGVSYLLEGPYEKLFNVKSFQDIVMQSDDDEILYKFARDVKGADIKRVIDRLPNGYARRELIHDLKPIGEEQTL